MAAENCSIAAVVIAEINSVPNLPKGAPSPDWDRERLPLRQKLLRSPALRARRNTLLLRAQAPEDRPDQAASLVQPAVGFQPVPLPRHRSIRTLSSDRKCWLQKRRRRQMHGSSEMASLVNPESFIAALPSPLVDAEFGAHIIVIGLQAFGRFAPCALDLSPLKHWRHRAYHTARQAILQIENLFKIAIELVRPDVRAGGCIDQLSGHTNPFSSFANAAFQHIANAKLTADSA